MPSLPTRRRPRRTADPPAIALAMALQPQGPHHAFHASVVTAGGEQLDFDSLVDLVRYLVRLSLVPSPPEGLQ